MITRGAFGGQSLENSHINKRKTIGGKVLLGLFVFALALILVISAAVSYGLVVMTNRHVVEDAFDHAGIAAHVIRGNKVEEYLKTGQRDEYYHNIVIFLDSLRQEVDAKRISVLVPDEKGVTYLWDSEKLPEKPMFGVSESWTDDAMKQVIMSAYGKNITEARLDEDTFTTDDSIIVFSPLCNSRGDCVSVVAVEIDKPDSWTIVRQLILTVAGITMLLTAIVMAILYWVLQRRFLGPIDRLTKGAENMVANLDNDEPVEIEVDTDDELETLADAFNKMGVDIRQYIGELSEVTAEKERVGAELDIASKIQTGFLPKLTDEFTKDPAFDLGVSMNTAKEVGGDFYDFFFVDETHIGLAVADASGKGVPAALFSVVTKVLLKSAIKSGMSPLEALTDVNLKLMEGNDEGFFITAWLAVIDIETGEGVAANAGHEHPAIRQTGGFYELFRYKHSPALAMFEETVFTEHEFTMAPGDSFFMYSDGVTEAHNSEGKLFGEERLLLALNKDREADPATILSNVRKAIRAFSDGAPRFDDITMLAFRYNGKN